MKNGLKIEFLLPKGFLYALFGFFILSAAPLSPSKEQALIRIELRDSERSARPYFSFTKSYLVKEINCLPNQEFLSSLLSQSLSFCISFKGQNDQVLMFTPI